MLNLSDLWLLALLDIPVKAVFPFRREMELYFHSEQERCKAAVTKRAVMP